MNLDITSERVIEAANACEDAKKVLIKLFPEVFGFKTPPVGTVWQWKNGFDSQQYVYLGCDEAAEKYAISRAKAKMYLKHFNMNVRTGECFSWDNFDDPRCTWEGK